MSTEAPKSITVAHAAKKRQAAERRIAEAQKLIADAERLEAAYAASRLAEVTGGDAR